MVLISLKRQGNAMTMYPGSPQTGFEPWKEGDLIRQTLGSFERAIISGQVQRTPSMPNETVSSLGHSGEQGHLWHKDCTLSITKHQPSLLQMALTFCINWGSGAAPYKNCPFSPSGSQAPPLPYYCTTEFPASWTSVGWQDAPALKRR